jgi:hypothetical protein
VLLDTSPIRPEAEQKIPFILFNIPGRNIRGGAAAPPLEQNGFSCSFVGAGLADVFSFLLPREVSLVVHATR